MVEGSRRIRFKLLAILGGLLVVLAACEIGLRVYLALTKDRGGKPEPVQGDVITIAKLHDIVARVPNDPNRLRILFLGDSYTRGVGVDPNLIFVTLVGELLEEWNPGRYVTINLGLPGNDTIGEWAVYNRVRDAARADVVVHVVSPRGLDADACQELYAIQEYVGRRFWTSRYSLLSALAENSYRRAVYDERFINYLKGGATQEQRMRSWRIFLREIMATRRLVEDGGAMYAMVHFPLVGYFETREYPLEDVHKRCATMTADLNVPYLDLLAPLRELKSRSLCVASGDLHPNAAAHAVSARAIVTFLKQSIFPKLPTTSTKKGRSPRTPEEITALEIQHHREILEMDPTCMGARLWLDRVRAQTGPPKK